MNEHMTSISGIKAAQSANEERGHRMTSSDRGTRRFASTGVKMIAVAVSALVMVLLGTSTAAATFPGGNGPIVFSSDRVDGQDIYKMDSNGTNLVQLTADSGLGDSGTNTDPVWTQDRTKIAFISDRAGNPDIYTMDADGNAETQITDTAATESDLSFNPDGTKLVYSSNADGDRELYVMDLTTIGDPGGPVITKLTNNNFEDYNADWSPNGNVIIFERQAGGVSPGRGYQIFSVSPEGGAVTDLSQTSSVIENGNPSFNGNGTRIAFQRRASAVLNWEIYTMNADGTVQTKRTNTPTSNNTSPVFSPSGTNGALDQGTGEKIAFVSNRTGTNKIFTMNANGSSQTNISIGTGVDTDPNWQALDIFPPDTEITVGPEEDEVLVVDNADFEFTSTEDNSTFECRLDPLPGTGSWGPCSTPYNTGAQADGEYTFNVRAIDPSGNVDPTPSTRNFVLDTTPPVVDLTDGPRGAWDGAIINFTDPVIEFTSPENSPSNVITFGCRVDPVSDDVNTVEDEETPWSDCSDGSFELSDLSEGDHTIQVRGTDPYGNTSAPVEATFEVDLTLPTTTIDAGPADDLWSSDNTPTYEFSASEQSTFECRITDSGQSDWAACTSPFTADALSDGPHTFQVRATDLALNVESPVTERLLNVDTTNPVTTIQTGPDNVTIDVDNANYTFDNDQPTDALFECSVDGAAFAPCTSPFNTGTLDNDDHTFAVRSTDRAGNLGAADNRAFTVYAPPRTLITSGPADGSYIPTGNASFEFTSEGANVSEATPTFECRVDSSDPGDWEACTSPLNVTGLNNGAHKVEVRAIGEGNRPDLTPAVRNFTVDKVDPDTSIVSGPAEGSLTNDPTFVFGSNEAGTFECEINGGTWDPCASGVPLTAPDGNVTLRVRAVDLAGNQDPTPVTRNFILDATAPETTIDDGPGVRTNDTVPTFEFSSSEPVDATFECMLDAGDWGACDSGSYTAEELADGEHTFRVRATDNAGNVDPSPATSTFTVDTVAPVATITDGPAADARINNTQPTFQLESDKAGSVFQCRVNEVNEAPAAWDTCSTGFQPAAPLDDGDYTFEVQAIDDVGNISTAPATLSFTVDTVAPTTTIDAGPAEASTIDVDNATFEFSSSEEGSTFVCSLETTGDPDDFQACVTPFEATDLGDGDYTFKVKSIDVAGNADLTGDVRNFSVDSPPNTTILPASDVADGGKTKKTTPDFVFSSNENDATFECRVDSVEPGDWAACTSPFTTPFLADGEHTVEVRAVDLAARPDLTPAKVTFTVDTVLPVTTFTGGPEDGDFINNASPEFSFESSKPNSTFLCSVDGGSFDPCSSPTTIGPLSEAAHTFAIKAVDEVTNEETPAKEVGFTVDITAPVTTVTVPTEAQAFTTNQPELEFTANEDATFECVIDGEDAVPCESPFETDELDDGAHTVTITATDLAGNVEAAPVTTNFTTEAPPRVTITSGIADGGVSNQTTQAFSFEASEVDATFECRVDSSSPGDWAACNSGFEITGLTEASHTFEVRAVAFDPPNDTSLKPAKVTFDIDLTKPTSSITSGPANGVTITTDSASIGFESNDGGTSFECRVGAEDFEACASPASLTGLDEGSNTFQVRAIDDAGNVQDPVTSRTFTVDTTTPVTTITSGPADGSTIANSTPSFVFSSSEAGTFDCKVDGGSFSACTSPFATAVLDDGSHTVTIRSTDANGLVEASPPSRTITVDTEAPSLSITSGPDASTEETTARFEFESDDPGATFRCSLDEGIDNDCDSPTDLDSLAVGDHTFTVTATDAAGNSSSDVSRTWTIKAKKPGTCPAGETGTPPNCVKPPPAKCDPPATGTPPNCVTPPQPTAGKLTKPKVIAKRKVKRGKALKITVKTRNVGETDLARVKVCLKTPKRLVRGKGKRCKNVGTLSGGGGAGKAVFRVKTKTGKKLRRKKIRVKAIVTGDGSSLKRGHVTILK